jgi:pectate lyase
MANQPLPPKTATPAALPIPPTAQAAPPPTAAADLPPGELASRRALLAQNMGFGGAATGGLAGPTITVTNLADAGPGSLRQALETPGPAWVVFGVDGAIQLRHPIRIQSDKTVDGRGRSIELQWRGLEIIGSRNVVVSNLRFRDGRADALSVRKGARQVWLDHLTLADFEDGLIDITHGASDVTVSWSRFEQHNKGMLIGGNPWDRGDVEIRVTLHHLYFVDVLRRLPKLRFGRAHAFNNMIQGWSGPAIELAFGGQLRLEGCIFVLKPDKSKAIVEMEPGAPGLVGGSGNDTGGLPLDASGAVFEPPYAYRVEPADAALAERLRTGAGWQP